MRFILLFTFMALCNLMQAQQQPITLTTTPQRCHHDEIHDHNYQTDEVYQHNYDVRKVQLDAIVAASSLQERAPCITPIIVPVAIHYEGVTTQDAACLEALALSQIAALNADYSASNPDVANYCVDADNSALDPNALAHNGACIIFCIATLNHPTGFGLNDGDYAITTNAGYNDFSATWSGYLNFFVRDAGGEILGYSPLFGNGNGDGVTITPCAFGTQGFGCGGFGPGNGCGLAQYNLGRTATHELGHYLGLNHIWGDGGCGQDDGFADTPTSGQEYYGCPAQASNSCGSDDMYMNYMDYVDDACMYMFSEEQATLMNNTASTNWGTTSTKCGMQTYAAPVVPNGCLNVVPVCFVSATSSPVSCIGNDGTVTATTANTVGTVTYAWSNGGTTAMLTGLAPNNYTVTITDGDGCTSTAMTAVNDDCNCNGLTVTAGVVNNVSCFDACDGIVAIQADGGDLNYTYTWSNGLNQQTENNLCVDTYTITVTDGQGCTDSATVTLSSPDEITVTSTSTQETCAGNDGTASVVGLPNYSYLWSNGFPSATSFGLTAGVYTVTITNTNTGCTATEDVVVGNSCTGCNGLTVTATVNNNVSCPGVCDGSATIQATGGNNNYSYTWSSGFDQATDNMLCDGTQTVTVVDSDGCSGTTTVTITEPAGISITATSTPENCGAMDGTATVTSVGIATLIYQWSNGITGPNNPNLSAGTYSVTATDLNSGCFTSETVIILDDCGCDGTLTYNANNITSAGCLGECNGAITGVAGNGTPNYTYSWNNGATTNSLTGLCAGNYSVTVMDALNCTYSETFTITEESPIVFSTSITDETCVLNDGAAFATGVGNLTFSWSNGVTGFNNTGLSTGNYTVTVTDNDSGCTATEIVFVDIDCGCNLAITITDTDASCNGVCDGSAQVTSNGNGVLYQWSNGATGDDLTNLCAGTYTVTATEGANCTAIGTVIISEPNPLNLTFNNNDAVCGDGTGSVAINPSGGTAPYTYIWSTGDTNSAMSGLNAGTYTVTITDANLCSASASSSLTGNIILMVSGVMTHPVCTGDLGSIDITVTGGLEPYTYSWNNGLETTEDINNIPSGNYVIIATDANNCSTGTSFNLSQPQEISINMTVINPTDGTDGSVIAGTSGGTSPYTWNWSNGGTSILNNNLDAGIYTVTVTDANGCIGVAEATVFSTNVFDSALVVDYSVHPNPSTGLFNLSMELVQQEDISIRVVNILGQTMFQNQYNGSSIQEQIDIQGLAQGTYFLEISVKNSRVVEKLMLVK